MPKPMRYGKSSTRRKIYSNKHLQQKVERYLISNLVLNLKEPGEHEQIKPQISRRRGIIKIRAKVNKIETKNYKI